jgi:hypothetical protein
MTSFSATSRLVSLLAPVALLTGACSNDATHEAPSPPVDAAVDASDPAALSAPPMGQGVQLKTGAFDVPANTEIQNCYFFKVSDLAAAAGLPADQPIEVHRVQAVQKAGSHHMNVFRVAGPATMLDPTGGTVTGMNGQGQCFNSANWAQWPLLANTQQAGDEDWSYPDGVANELQPDEYLMLQSHYVNASTQKTPGGGQVAINLWTMPKAQVTAQLGTLFATDQNIRICQSNPTPTFTQGCQFNSPSPVTIVGANGHFHSRGKEFDMYVWDGKSTTPDTAQRFYQSTTWDEPPMLHSPSLEQKVPAMGGVFYSCTYDWQPPPSSTSCDALNMIDETKGTPASMADCCYRFGGVVDKNEHCNAFVYYYPKQDDVTCQ